MITFDNKTGLVAEDTAKIRERRAAEWKAAFATDPDLPELNTEEETPAGQIIDGEVALVSEKDSEMLYIANMFDPFKAEGIWQDALGNIYFLNRHILQFTTVLCDVTGIFGTIIPYGAIVQDKRGNTFINTIVTIIGENGTAQIRVRCTIGGPVEVGSDMIDKIVSTIPGWDTVNNTLAGVAGIYEETQAEFENRRYESVAKNSHGAATSVFANIANINEVIACRVIENNSWQWINKNGVDIGPHSFYVSVYGGAEDDIAKAIYEKVDGGCAFTGTTELTYVPVPEDGDQEGAKYTYYIVRPKETPVGIIVTIRRTKETSSNIEDAIKETIMANFNGQTAEYPRVRMAMTLYSSRFYKPVISAGVVDLEKIQIKYPASDDPQDSVEIPANEMPVLSENDITVIILN